MSNFPFDYSVWVGSVCCVDVKTWFRDSTAHFIRANISPMSVFQQLYVTNMPTIPSRTHLRLNFKLYIVIRGTYNTVCHIHIYTHSSRRWRCYACHTLRSYPRPFNPYKRIIRSVLPQHRRKRPFLSMNACWWVDWTVGRRRLCRVPPTCTCFCLFSPQKVFEMVAVSLLFVRCLIYPS